MDKSKYILYTDGGSRNNPGPAAIGGVVYDDKDEKVFEYSKYIGVATNNIAEYRSLVYGLSLCIDKGIKNLKCYLDSELIVKQLKKEYKVKNHNLKVLYSKIASLLEKFDKISFEHVPREKNKVSDSLVNEALDKYQSDN